jgi:GNAT superfamily N-acetyltransferase
MPIDLAYLRTLHVERFDGSRHDRGPFTCGVERIDNFLKISASGFIKDDNGRIYVAIEREGGRLVGFYAIGPHSIDVSALNPDMVKRGVRVDKLPAFYLSMIATYAEVQGKGLGSYLLADVFRRCLAAADAIGGRFLILDATNERAAALYARAGFVSLVSQPERRIVSMAKLRANAEAAAANAGGYTDPG